jgi:hypothetical protein
LYESENWREQGHVFLFIYKSNTLGDGYELRKADYDFFPLEYSYVSCGGLVVYPQEFLDNCTPQLKGRLLDKHLAELYHALQASETMVQREIALACAALRPFL